jgi:hypothetical protein
LVASQAPSRPARRSTNEAARIRIVSLIFLVYWLLIFEGVLRKWVFPNAQQYLFFIRDPVVLLVYLLVLKDGLLPRVSLLLSSGVLLGIAGLASAAVLVRLGNLAPVVAAYGWRNYFFYIPLLFVIERCVTYDDLSRLFRQTLVVAIPIAVLVIFQFLAPMQSVINAGLIEGGVYNPGVVRGIVRTFGTFTNSPGEGLFIGSTVAMLVTVWILPRSKRPVRGLLLLLSTCAVLICLALSGSRGAYFAAALIVLAGLASSLVMRHGRMKQRALVVPVMICSTLVLLATTVFLTASQALLERFAGAYRVESQIYAFGIVGRALSSLTSFGALLSTTPLLGYGLGTFGNAFAASNIDLLTASGLTEDDWARNVAELGPTLGLMYIALRIALVVWLVRGALRATRQSNNPMPILLVGFSGFTLLSGQITGLGTGEGYGWLFAGFSAAANRVLSETHDVEWATDDAS